MFANIYRSNTRLIFKLPGTTAKFILIKDNKGFPSWYPNILVNFSSDNYNDLKKKMASNILSDEGNRILIRDPENHVFAITQNDDDVPFTEVVKENNLLGIFTVEFTISNEKDTPRWYHTDLGLPLAFHSEKNSYWEYALTNNIETLSLTSAENCSQYKKNNGVFLLIETADVNTLICWLKSQKIQTLNKTLNILLSCFASFRFLPQLCWKELLPQYLWGP